jgi:peptidoglycan/LPS O-acetylase OafA/YrhL
VNERPAARSSLPSLTGLRFLAAMAVVLSHFSEQHMVSVPARLVSFLDGGRTAVSLFFVLSGFVLAYNYADLRSGQRRRYYAARFARIYPVLVLALLVAVPTVLYARHRPVVMLDWFAVRSHPSASLAASLGAQLTMTTGWFPVAALNQPWDSPAWSVACEAFFYLAFPLLILTMRKLSTRTLLGVTAVGWALQALWIAAVKAEVPANRSGFLVSQFPLTHALEFIVGVAAGLWFLRGGRVLQSVAQARGAVIAAATAALAGLSAWQPVKPAYLLMTPFFAVLIVSLATPSRHRRQVLGAPLLVLLGEASYSLYLLHIPEIHLMQVAGWTGAVGWLGMAAAVGVSVVVFRTYETPMRLTIRRWAASSGHPPAPRLATDDATPLTAGAA